MGVALRPALQTSQLVGCSCQLQFSTTLHPPLEPLYWALKACQSQHGCISLCSHLPPSSIHNGKASVQQLWHPCQRAGRSSQPDFLPAREVPKYSNPAWREKMRQLLQRGGDALPDEALAPPLLLLDHRGQQRRVQEEEEGGQDVESYLAKACFIKVTYIKLNDELELFSRNLKINFLLLNLGGQQW